MPIGVVLAAIAIAASIPILVSSVGSRRSGSGVFVRRAERGESVELSEMILDRGAGERVVLPAFGRALRFLRRFTPAGIIDTIDRRIELAGKTGSWPVELFLVFKIVAAAGVGWAGFSFRGTVVGLAGIGLGYILPDFALDAVARNRQEKIQQELPNAIDHITMSVEAGIGFEAAMTRAAAAGRGPLAFELRRALQEMQLGVPRGEALRNMADRSDVVDLRTFVTAVVQSEDYGLPVAHVLRTQSAELRVRRRQRAEERALKIPVKMTFPLVLCIFPALFIVLLGPAAIRISNTLFST